MTTFALPVIPIPAHGFTPLGEGESLITGIWADDTPYPQASSWGERPKFQWEDPTSDDDALNGGYCERSRIWFPGHELRDIEGRSIGAPFARPLPRQDAIG